MDEITPPVSVERSSCYYKIVDAEGRLVTFISISVKSGVNAHLIAGLLNQHFKNEPPT